MSIFTCSIWWDEFSNFRMIFDGVDRKNLVSGEDEIAPRKVGLLFNNNSWLTFHRCLLPLKTSLYTLLLYKNGTIDPIRSADGEHHPRRRKRRETAKAQCRTYTRSPKDILYLFSPPPGPRWKKSSFSIIWLQYICIFIYVCMCVCCIYVYR